MVTSPPATSEITRRVMKGNRRKDTKPEIRLRKLLFGAGLRYRVDYPIRPDSGRPVRADVAFPRLWVAVFVDGCFWHACPEHAVPPKSNRDYWVPKLERNAERDAETTRRLAAAGWSVLRIWEHEDPEAAARRVLAIVRRGTTPAGSDL